MVQMNINFEESLERRGLKPGEHVSIGVEPEGGEYFEKVLDVADAAAAVARLGNDKCNVWIGLNPTSKPIGSTGRGKDVDGAFTRLSGLTADLDVKPGGCPNAAAAEQIINDLSAILRTRPSVITYTGHGIQPTWAVEDCDTDTGRPLLKRWGRLVTRIAGSRKCGVDNVFQMSRMMRTGDTWNVNKGRHIRTYTVDGGGGPLTVEEIEEALDRANVSEMPGDGDTTDNAATPAEVHEFISAHTESAVPTLMSAWKKIWNARMDNGDSRHNSALHIVAGAMEEAAAGLFPAKEFLDWFESVFIAAKTRPPVGGEKQLTADQAHAALWEPSGIIPWAIGQARTTVVAETLVRTYSKLPSPRLAEHMAAQGLDDPRPESERMKSEDQGDEKSKDEKPKAGRVLKWRTGSEVTDGVPEWAWTYDGNGSMMRNTLVLLAGRPEAGKSTAARWFAAGYTTGTMAGCFEGKPQHIAYIAAEESLEYMVKPSLRAVGADMDRVHFPHVEMNGEQVQLLSSRDEDIITESLIARGITVVVVDPIMAGIDGGVDINRNNEVRTCIGPWSRIADKINGLVIGIVHLKKAPGGDVVAAINGSSAFGEIARSIIAFAPDDESSDGEHVMSVVKNSAGRDKPSITYTIEDTRVETDGGVAQVGRFVMGDRTERSVSEVLSQTNTKANLGPRMLEVIGVCAQCPSSITPKYVAQMLSDMDSKDAAKYLARAVKYGLLVKRERGVYGMPGS